MNPEQIEAFWKREFILSMQEIEPRFKVDSRNRELIQALYSWVWKRKSSLDPQKGLLIWGPIGVGKSILIRGLQRYEGKINRMAFAFGNDSLGFTFISAAELALKYAEKGLEGISSYTNRERMQNLAIDEVGREPMDSKHFGTSLNVIQTILQLRYEVRNQFITHMTTNLNPDIEFATVYGEYIADRVKEMFNVIELKGESRR